MSSHELADRLRRTAASAGVESLLDRGRADEAAAARTRHRWLSRQAADDATLADVVVDVAERGSPVDAQTSSGRTYSGVITGIGHDYIELATTRSLVLIRTVELNWLRLGSAIGGRIDEVPARRSTRSFASALADLAEPRPAVTLRFSGQPSPLIGALESCGTDICTLELASRQRAHVQLSRLSEVVVGG